MAQHFDNYQARKAVTAQLNDLVHTCNHHKMPLTIIFDGKVHSNMDQEEIATALT
jgi:hypothetical protein